MISNYFSSGNVYVIDDIFEEAKPIIDSLYKHQIPHIFSDGSRSNLPKTPQHVRLIFLDLNLYPATNPASVNDFKSKHSSILNALLANNSSSYIVLIWSKEEDTKLADFKDMLEDKAYQLSHRKPIEIIELNKKSYFNEISNDNGDTEYEFIDGKEQELHDLINEKLKENDAFKTLTSWETIIKKSSNKTVDYIFELAQNEVDQKKKLKELISSLSISYLGYGNFFEKLNGDNQRRTDGFFYALSELIDDEIEKEIFLNKQYEFSDWCTEEELKKINLDFTSKLNSKFLISKDTHNNELTGSIYKVSKTKHPYVDILNDCIEADKLNPFIKAYNEGKTKPEEQVDKKNYIKRRFRKHVTENIFIPIELNITPLCDIVQKKEKYYRLIPGMLIRSDYHSCLKRSSERDFQSPVFYLDNYNSSYKLVLDYRFFHSSLKKEMNKLDKIFTLRKNFVDDIQLKLSNHVSRLGVLNL